MVDLRPSAPSIVTLLARPAACDALATGSSVDAVVCRVAPDEVLLVGRPDMASTVIEAAAAVVRPLDPEFVTVDVTDGWTAFELAGHDAREAFERLSELRLPAEGFVQGEVARLPAKVMVARDRVTVLVPAMWGAALHGRIVAAARAAGLLAVRS